MVRIPVAWDWRSGSGSASLVEEEVEFVAMATRQVQWQARICGRGDLAICMMPSSYATRLALAYDLMMTKSAATVTAC
jgi:hypothetical protein